MVEVMGATLSDFGAFVEGAAFAKVVVGHGNEEMLLVNGKVYRVIGPEGPCADFFARAFRQMRPAAALLSEGCSTHMAADAKICSGI